ncbi:MAG: HD domain-containing protein [Polyangiales bacterium]
MLNLDPREPAARAYAVERHGAQAYGKEPYIVHLAAVRSVLADFDISGDLGVAAWLHDTIEDTGTTRGEIVKRFGEQVAALVWAVSGLGATRKQRNLDAYQKIRALPTAATLKLADRIANVEASRDRPDKLAMYRAEHQGFATALTGLGEDRLWERLRKALAP